MSDAAPSAPAPAPAPAAPASKYKDETLKDLDPRIQKQIDVADKAIDKNAAYAIDLCTSILATHPGCVDVRKVLRKAQKRAAGPKPKGMTRLFGGLTNTPFVMKASSQIKSDPKSVLENAEKMLTQNPSNVQALKMEGAAAAAMSLWSTAVFAYDNVREIEPDNVENLMNLSNALIDAQQPKEAIRWGERILELQPGNPDAQAMLRRASVAVTVDKGKWEEGTDFRQKLADKDKAIELEQAARMSNDADTLTALVNKIADNIAKDPENINFYRDIIGYLKQLQRFDEALEWVRKARMQPLGKGDTTLEKLEADMTVAQMKTKIETLEKALAEGEDAAKRAELDGLRKSELEFRLNQAKNLVEKYPNDFGFRFDYGTLLLETNQIDASIRELQLARRNPKVSHRAMLNLGRAYKQKGIMDLAVEQFTHAKNEMPLMSDLKKEIMYELAGVYRKQGHVDKAVDEYKSIYANDIDYKDVAKIINEYYEKRTLS